MIRNNEAMTEPIFVTCEQARRFLIHAFALTGGLSLTSVDAVLDRLEFIQEDSINVCGRMHDLILRNRIVNYAPSLLHGALYQEPRTAFEYYFPNLCVLPLRDYPYFRGAMLSRRMPAGCWGGLTPEEEPVAKLLIEQIETNGPLRSRLTSVEHGHATSGWGTRAKVASLVLDKLWYQGHLTIAHRENFERWFDLAHRRFSHWESTELPQEDETIRYKLRKRLRAKRLFRLPKEALSILGASSFVPLRVESDSRPWYILAEDKEAFFENDARSNESDAVRLLAPLDPLIYDRERNRKIFDFDYTWEVYTPAEKRKWGYYILPILWKGRIVGRVDPKIDRASGTLLLHSLTMEKEADAVQVAPAIAEAVQELAIFLGATRIQLPKNLPESIGGFLTD